MQTRLMTAATDFAKARSLNATDTSFNARTTLGGGPLVDFGGTGQSAASTVKGVDEFGVPVCHNAAVLVPYGTGDDDDVFAMRVTGWRPLRSKSSGVVDTWVAMILAELTCTLSTAVGATGGSLLSTERLCDTIVLVTGNDDITISIISPANNTPAHVMLDFCGCPVLEWQFDTTTGDPTGCNCLYAFI